MSHRRGCGSCQCSGRIPFGAATEGPRPCSLQGAFEARKEVGGRRGWRARAQRRAASEGFEEAQGAGGGSSGPSDPAVFEAAGGRRLWARWSGLTRAHRSGAKGERPEGPVALEAGGRSWWVAPRGARSSLGRA
jgi:hypothetical protein